MAKLLKLRRGTTSQHSSFTGAEGEVTVDTTKDTLVVHDGSTAGGHPISKESANLSASAAGKIICFCPCWRRVLILPIRSSIGRVCILEFFDCIV